MEAHGGYSFCGAASLALLGNASTCNLESLLRWTVNRQMRLEGGFQGRTNKLVDGCYSFWQGATVPIIQTLILKERNKNKPKPTENIDAKMMYESLLEKEILFDHRCLQEYILMACQNPRGGLIDKPGKPRDFYHTCYTLSGLSIAQHLSNDMTYCIDGHESLLTRTHLLYNLPPENVNRAINYFKSENLTKLKLSEI
uniref:Putative beta subunit of farnesyltransferase n=1 Tax=Xenopsylla cheopis TaxID=163159 RepID=A0A6M2E3M5_XENCH